MCVGSSWGPKWNTRFESHVSWIRTLNTHLLRMSAIYERTKVPWRHFHVRARGPALHAKRTKRLLDAIKPRFLSCYPPETSSGPRIPEPPFSRSMCVASRAEMQKDEPGLIFMVLKSSSLDSYPSTLFLPCVLSKWTRSILCAPQLRSKCSCLLRMVLRRCSLRQFTPIIPSNLSIRKPKTQDYMCAWWGGLHKKTGNDPSYGVEVLGSRQLTPNSKRRSGNFMSAAHSRTLQENHGSSIYWLKPRPLRNLHSYNIPTSSKYRTMVGSSMCVPGWAEIYHKKRSSGIFMVLGSYFGDHNYRDEPKCKAKLRMFAAASRWT